MSKKWSNFHITVNLNVPPAQNANYVQGIIDSVHDLATPEWLWTWLKRYDNGGKRDFVGAEKMDVETVRMRVGIEQGGGQNGSIHAHILLEVGHRTAVQVDFQGIKDCFRDNTGREVNVDVKYLRGDGAMKQYILKYITKEVPRVNVYSSRQEAELSRAFHNGAAAVVNQEVVL